MSNVIPGNFPYRAPQNLEEHIRTMPMRGLHFIISDIEKDTTDEYEQSVIRLVNEEFNRRFFRGVVDEVALMRARKQA